MSWNDDFRKTRKIQKKSFFCPTKIISQKSRVFLNQNLWRYEILVKTKKFRLDVTISEKQEKYKKSHVFGLRKIISRTTRFFLNRNRLRYEILINRKSFVLTWRFQIIKINPKIVIFSAYRKLLAKKQVFFNLKPLKIWNFIK